MNEQNGRFSVQTPLGAPPVLGTQTCYEAPCNLQVKRIFVIAFEEEFVYISKAMIARISTFCIEILKCSQKYYKDILVTVKTFFFLRYITRNSAETTFPQNIHTRKLGKISVFCTVLGNVLETFS